MELNFPLTAGLIAAVLHVLAGPDHLAAVLPFAIESKKKAWKVGLFWGIGHLLGMLLIGILFLLFKELIPIEKISEHSEQLVGLVLIGIGVWSLLRIFKEQRKHKHVHIHTENEPVIHEHTHDHSNEQAHNHKHTKQKRQSYLASLGIGLLHGLAGVAHFLLFLPVIGFESEMDSVVYIIGFALGTIVAMVSFAFVIGKMAAFSKTSHHLGFFNGIRLSGGLIAIIVGIYWVFSTI